MLDGTLFDLLLELGKGVNAMVIALAT